MTPRSRRFFGKGSTFSCEAPQLCLEAEPKTLLRHRKSSELGRESLYEPPVRILLVGDVSGARDIRENAQADSHYMFRHVSRELQAADITFGNFECAVPSRVAGNIHLLTFEGFPEVLAEAGFDVVSLANNHAFDAGLAGFTYTSRLLEDSGVQVVGGPDGKGKVFAVRGVKVGFHAYVTPELAPSSKHPAILDLGNLDPLRKLRSQVDCLIVSVHWGQEYTVVNDRQRQLANALIGAGADVVVGHHPHVSQEIQPFGTGKWVFYSLGNFVFDSHVGGTGTKQGFAVSLDISKQGVLEMRTLPYEILKDHSPRWLSHNRVAASPNNSMLGREYWGLDSRFATLSDSDKEDREAERLVQQSPKKKPPRNDLRRNTPRDEEKDPDKEQDRKDRSNNYKDAASSVKVALLWVSAAKKKNLTTVRRKEDGKIVQVSEDTLRTDSGKYEEVDPEEQEAPKKKKKKPNPDAPEEGQGSATPSPDAIRKGLMSKYMALGLTDYEVDQRFDLMGSRGAKPEEIEKLLNEDAQKSSVMLKMKGGLPALRKKLTQQYTEMGLTKAEIQKSVSLVQEGIQAEDLDEIKKILEDRAKEIDKTKTRKEEILKGGVRTPSALKKFKKEVSDLYSDLGVDGELISEELDALQAGASEKSLKEILKVFDAQASEVAQEKERVENKKVYKKVRAKPLAQALDAVGKGGNQEGVNDYLSGLPPEDFSDFQKTFEAEVKRLQEQGPGDLDKFNETHSAEGEVLEGDGGLGDLKNPQALARALARRKFKQEVLDDPTYDAEDPLPKAGTQPSADEAEKALARAERAVSKYRDMPREEREGQLDKIEAQMKSLKDGDPRKQHLEALKKGIGVASALTDGMDAEGIGGSMARLIAAADKGGNLKKILALKSSPEGSEEERVEASRRDQELIREIFRDVDDDDWEELLPEDHPGRGWAKLLGVNGSRHLNSEERSILRENLSDLMLGELEILEPEIDDQVDERATRRIREDAARAARRSSRPDPGGSGRNPSAIKSWVANFLKDLAENAKSKVQDFVRGVRQPSRSQPPSPPEPTPPEPTPPTPDSPEPTPPDSPPPEPSRPKTKRKKPKPKKPSRKKQPPRASPARVASLYLIFGES